MQFKTEYEINKWIKRTDYFCTRPFKNNYIGLSIFDSKILQKPTSISKFLFKYLSNWYL